MKNWAILGLSEYWLIAGEVEKNAWGSRFRERTAIPDFALILETAVGGS